MSEDFNNLGMSEFRKNLKLVTLVAFGAFCIGVMISFSMFIMDKKDTINNLYTILMDDENNRMSVVSITKVEGNYVAVINDHGDLKVAVIATNTTVPLNNKDVASKEVKEKPKLAKSVPVSKVDTRPVQFGSAKTDIPVVNGRYCVDTMSKRIDRILHEIPCIEASENMRLLILETMIAESNLKPKVPLGGGAYGNIQMLPSTCKYLIRWMKENEPASYQVVMNKYNRDLSIRDNLINNMPFQISVCAMYYYHRANGQLDNRIASLDSRSKFWKKEYNTHLGAGTSKAYQKRVNHVLS